MMPVKSLPLPSWETALGLGFVSAVFDNIPLTALAIKQGNYDWGFLAYAVGFGGSMIWFGSSAGVAVAGLMPEARSAARWLKEGWPVVLGYVVGFFLMLALLGWNPENSIVGPTDLRAWLNAKEARMYLIIGFAHRAWSCFGWNTDSKGHL